MLFLKRRKDGGIESTVTGYWLIEYKPLLSILLLKFEGKSREAFHNHAFNCWSFILKGELIETMLDCKINNYKPFRPFVTRRTYFHKVDSDGTTWLFTIRGPWLDKWNEFIPKLNKFLTLTHNRKILED